MLNFKGCISLVVLLTGLVTTGCNHQPSAQGKEKLTQEYSIENTTIIKSPNDKREYSAIKLPNGLQAVLVTDPESAMTAISLAVGVGSFQNPENQLGLAHYLEHMLFLGTEKYPEPLALQKFIDKNGGVWNATTSSKLTNYFFQIKSDQIDPALDYFSEYFKAPKFDEAYGDKERNAVNSEWSRGRTDDFRILYLVDGLTSNPSHPIKNMSVGNLETLSDKPGSNLHEALIAFYKQYYSANIMKLTIVGSQSQSELKSLVEKYFASIPNKNVDLPKVTIPGLTPNELAKHIYVKTAKDLKYLAIDFPMQDNTAEWRLKPNKILQNLLSSEQPGTLGGQLVKLHLAKSVSASASPNMYGSDGVFSIKISLTDEGMNNQDNIVAMTFAYIDFIKKQGIDKRFYEETKAVLDKGFANLGEQKSLNLALDLTGRQFILPVANLINANYVYDKFDKSVIDKVLAQLVPEKSRIWHVGNNQETDTPVPYYEGSYKTRAITQEEFSRWAKSGKKHIFSLPAENDLISKESQKLVKNIYAVPTKIMDLPGAEAWLMHPQIHQEDKGLIELDINVNFGEENINNYIASQLLSDLFRKHQAKLNQKASEAGFRIGIQTTSDKSQNFSTSGYAAQQPKLMTDTLTEFSHFQPKEETFITVLDDFKIRRKNLKKEGGMTQLMSGVGRVIDKNARWSDEEILAAADKITLADVVAYHQHIIGNNLIRVYAFGNFSEESIKQITSRAAELFKSNLQPHQRHKAETIVPQAKSVFKRKIDVDAKDNAFVQIYTDLQQSPDVQAQMTLLNKIFRTEFFVQLRTNEQMGYSVGSQPFGFNEYPGFMMYLQSTNTELPAIKRRFAKFRTDYLLKLKELDATVIDKMKAAEIAKLNEKPKDFMAEAYEHLADFREGKFTFDRTQRKIKAIEQVSKENLIASYNKILLEQGGMQIELQARGSLFKDKFFAEN